MKTVAELCDFCEKTENIPKTLKRKTAEKQFQMIVSSLAADEDILLAFNGFLNWKTATKNDGLFSIGVTDNRIIMALKIAFTQDIKTIKRDKITSVSFATHEPFTNFSTITVSTVGEEYKITMDIKSGPIINAQLQALI